MSRDAPRVDVFGIALVALGREGDRHLVRATLQAAGLNASVGTVLGRDEVDDLHAQIDRQYGDFRQPVSWESRASPTLRLHWRLDPQGHLEGQVEIRDRAEGWAATARVRGDQSYLPRILLGLRLLVR